MKPSHFDRTIIHGLGLLSRPPIVPDPADHRMLVEILQKAAPRASAGEGMAALLREVRRIGDNRGPYSGIAHNVARAMNEFDRHCMAAHWDAAKGGR